MISQMDYENYNPSQERRETPAEREVRQLRRRIDEMEAEKLGMTVQELEEKRFQEFCNATQPPKESAALASIRQEMERQQRAAESWLAAWGVPAESSDELKSVVVNLRCELSQTAIIGLVAACVGEDLNDSEPTGRQMVRMFPKLAPSVQKAFVQAAAAFTYLRNKVPFNG